MSYLFKFLKFLIYVLIFQLISSFKYPINKNLIDAELSEITSAEISTKSEFDKYIMNNDYVISIFHADWCGHCKRFLPIFDEASRYKIINNKWKFLKIPCSKYESLCNSFSIDGYPTIKTFKKSKEISSKPPRELDSFLEFLIKISSDPLIYISNNDINKFYNDYGTFSPLIEYNPNSKNNFIECIKNLANKEFLSDYYFGLLKINENKERIIFNFDNNSVIYNWNEKCNEAKNFLNNNIYPLVTYVDIGFMRKLFRNKKTLFLIIFYSNNNKINDFVKKEYKNISINNRNLVFGYVYYNEDKDIINYFKINLSKESEIQILIYDFGKEIRYIHPSIYDINITKEKELEISIRELLKNINNLPFSTGSKFKDFMRKIGLYDMSETTKIIIIVFIFVLLIGFLCLLVFCCDSEDIDEIDIKDESLLNKNKKVDKKQIKEEGKDNKKQKIE